MTTKTQRKSKSQPGNYILIGSKEYLKEQAVETARKEATLFPDYFEGEEPFFIFELRYHAPFDKDFKELKRLQGTAARSAGRRDEFRGYAIIDLNDYLTHEKERYFEMTMYFLADMSDYWKYIFLVDNTNDRATKLLVSKALGILLQSFFCEIRETSLASPAKRSVDVICREQGIECSDQVREFLQKVWDVEKDGTNIVDVLLREVSVYLGPNIEMHELLSFCQSNSMVVKYMLSDKQQGSFMRMLEHNKEGRQEGRDAV